MRSTLAVLAISVPVALRTLRANPLRSALTALGIVIGVAAVVATTAIGAGARAEIDGRIRTLGTNLLMVLPGSAEQGGARLGTGSRPTLTEDDADAIAREVPWVLATAPTVSGEAQVVRAGRNWSTLVGGITPDYFAVRDWEVRAGRPLGGEDMARMTKVAVIGTSLAERLFGAEDPVGQPLRINAVPFTVIGVLGSKGQNGTGRDQDDVILVPLSTAKGRLLGARAASHRSVDFVLIKAAAPDRLEEVERQTVALLRQRHGLARGADDFAVRNPAAPAAARAETMRLLGLLLASVAAVSLLVGGISVMNTMLVSVTERTREIGLRLSVGARPADIRSQFLVESALLSLIGGVIGILAGVAASAAVAGLAGWPVLVEPATALVALAFSAAVGLAFGFYPATKAARLDPIEALRCE